MCKVKTLDVLEKIYMDGCADEVSGHVDSPTGHFYRVGTFIVFTDSQGFHNVEAYGTEEKAREAFEKYDNKFSEWNEE